MKAGSVKIFLIYVMLCLIWGSTWLAIRFGLETLTPMYSAGVRFLLASFFILIFNYKCEKSSFYIRGYPYILIPKNFQLFPLTTPTGSFS